MGCFDEVRFLCPDCGEGLYAQSKAGECNMSTFPQEAVPLEIAGDVNGDVEVCECGARVKIVAPFGDTIVMLAIKV